LQAFAKWVVGVLATLGALYVAAFCALAVMQRSILYQPRIGLVTPAQAGLSGIETLQIKSGEAETLEAWFAAPKDARFPLILYFHGNGGALYDRHPRFRALTQHGFGLLAVSYRGYGASTGVPTQAGILQDAEAAYAEARRRGFTPDRIVLMGESLGSGVATQIAARREAAALVLDSPYDSLLDVASSHFTIFPVGLVLRDTYRSDEVIGAVHVPVLMAHGDADPVISFASAQRLFARANEPKQFIPVVGGGHLVLGLPEALPRVIAWIDTVATRGAAP
jgi:fermentation-respiration switch protein FrsA (DUF1100 family)